MGPGEGGRGGRAAGRGVGGGGAGGGWRGGGGREATVSKERGEREGACRGGARNSYLPGRGDTMITKVVFPGRGLSIALRMC